MEVVEREGEEVAEVASGGVVGGGACFGEGEDGG